MKVAQVNIQRGLRDKIHEVGEWCKQKSVSIIAVSETGLCSEFCDSPHVCATVPQLDGWRWVGVARNNRGGGVGFLIRSNVAFDIRPDLNANGTEQCWIEVHRHLLPSILFCSVYIPPGKSKALEVLSETVQRARNMNTRIMLMGDFNARCVLLGDSVDNNLSDVILSLISLCDLQLHNVNGVPTRFAPNGSNSILDLCLSTADLAPLISKWAAFDDLPTDHRVIAVHIGQFPTRVHSRPAHITWDLKRCDWSRFTTEVQVALTSWLDYVQSPLVVFSDIDALYQSWLDCLMRVVHKFVPLRKLTHRSRAFWTPEIARLVATRRKCLRLFRKWPNEVNRERYRAAHHASRAAIRRSREQLEKDCATFLATASRQDVFNRFRKSSKNNEEPVPTLVVNDEVLTEREQQTHAFNTFFSSAGEERTEDGFDNNFKCEVDSFVNNFDYRQQLRNYDGPSSPITLREIEEAIADLGSHKAPGPDKVHPMFLKKGGRAIIRSLCFVFNSSFTNGVLPVAWKTSSITPIPKRMGSKINVYRPIALLSIPGKLMDKICANRLSHVAEQLKWFSPVQGGFRPNRRAEDQLLTLRERIVRAWSNNKVCVCAFLDLSRAYDRVWREAVVYKLIHLGLRGCLLVWIRDFLQGRKGAVSIAGVCSDTVNYKFGLPQGACMSPLLFNVLLSDLFPTSYVSEDKDATAFADDIRLASYASTVEAASKLLSEELSTVRDFARKWRLKFDLESDKCGTMLFSPRRIGNREKVTYGEMELNQFSHYKYLGVIFDPHLRFTQHIERVRQRAWAAYHKIRKYTSRFWGASVETMLLLYRAYVQPVIEYSCAVWCLASRASLERLTPIHTAALRAATGASSTTSRESLNSYCGFWSLETRREYLCTTLFVRSSMLSPAAHPLARCYDNWCNSDIRNPFSFFSLGASFCRAQQRHQDIGDGGVKFREREHTPEIMPWHVRPRVAPLKPRKEVVESHLKVFSEKRHQDIFVYTDGSCIENPGRAGIGILILTPESSSTFSEYLGIASILTAELCAIRKALQFLCSSLREDCLYKVAHICVDNIAALRLSQRSWISPSNVEVTNEIHRYLRILKCSGYIIKWHWTPSHEGIPGNERADELAKESVANANELTPSLFNANQPPIPTTLSKSVIKRALNNRENFRWLQILSEHLGEEHLSRLHTSISANKRFFVGSRQTQTALARLRLAHSSLNAHAARFYPINPICECGLSQETTSHFLLDCKLYNSQREALKFRLSNLLPYDIPLSEGVLLGSENSPIHKSLYPQVAKATMDFIWRTERLE